MCIRDRMNGNVGLKAQLPLFDHDEVIAVPSALYSANLSVKGACVKECDDFLLPALQHYQMLGIRFDGIGLGLLRMQMDIEQIASMMCHLCDGVKLIDPIFADHGKYYTGYDERYLRTLKKVLPMFDVMTPNSSEALLLSNRSANHLDEWKEVAKTLAKQYEIMVVITGIVVEDCPNQIHIVYGKEEIEVLSLCRRIEYSGAGDVFSASVLKSLLDGNSLKTAVQESAWLVEKLFIESMKQKRDSQNGLISARFIENINRKP